MIATAIPMPYHISIIKPLGDEHSALSLKEYVRSSLHCIKISRAMEDCMGMSTVLTEDTKDLDTEPYFAPADKVGKQYENESKGIGFERVLQTILERSCLVYKS